MKPEALYCYIRFCLEHYLIYFWFLVVSLCNLPCKTKKKIILEHVFQIFNG